MRIIFEWPPQSPDFNPIFAWRHMESKVYNTPHDTVKDLRERMVTVCRELTPEMLQNVGPRFESNLYIIVWRLVSRSS